MPCQPTRKFTRLFEHVSFESWFAGVALQVLFLGSADLIIDDILFPDNQLIYAYNPEETIFVTTIQDKRLIMSKHKCIEFRPKSITFGLFFPEQLGSLEARGDSSSSSSSDESCEFRKGIGFKIQYGFVFQGRQNDGISGRNHPIMVPTKEISDRFIYGPKISFPDRLLEFIERDFSEIKSNWKRTQAKRYS